AHVRSRLSTFIVFHATIAPLHEVARPLTSSDRPSELTEAEEGPKYFFTKQTQFILDFVRFFWVRLKFRHVSLPDLEPNLCLGVCEEIVLRSVSSPYST
ncbi:MAG: hypothetical protein ACLQDV_21795, partial [Candidatus Binataceae bacterium]